MESEQTKKRAGSFLAFMSFIGIEEEKSIIVFIVLISLVIASSLLSFSMMAPFSFPVGKTITIEKGASLSMVSSLLYDENIIRSKTLFELSAKLIGGEKPIAAGDYLFKAPVSVSTVAMRIARGVSGIPQARITIPEGMSNNEMAVVFGKALPSFDRNSFFEMLNSREGYLFPDTYFFKENVTNETIGEIMFANFNKKVAPLQSEIDTSGHSLRDVVIMASILEKEAVTAEDRAIISGILWKRIKMGMPLQVDATFMYLLGKKSSELTLGDLEMKSAYNTYRNKGLPYGPIGNPGLDTITAAIHPVTTPYLYYLSDDEGVMHYAKTFTEHKANKVKYLK